MSQHQSKRGSFAMNAFALALTVLPLFSMGLFTYQAFFSDARRVSDLGYIEHASAPRLFQEPIISVTFDDGWESVYSNAASLLSQYDIPTTQYILPGEFNSPNYISAAQAQSLKKAGHEITSHTFTHPNLTKLSQDEVKKQLDDSLRVLKDLRLTEEADLSFAPPEGALNQSVLGEVKSRFASSRNTMGDLGKDISDNDMNVAGKFNRYDIIGYTVGQYTTDEQLRGALAYAKAHNAWFVPTYHQIDDSGSKYSVTKATFERHLKLYKESGIKIATMRDVITHNKEAR